MKTEAAPAAAEEVSGVGRHQEICRLQLQAGVLGKIGIGSEREIIPYLLNPRMTNIKSSQSSTLIANT